MTEKNGQAALESTMFTFSRDGEYLDAGELQTMTGQPVRRFPEVVIKEACDNGLDAAEKAGVAPRLTIVVRRRGDVTLLSVRDNGGGIPPEAVKKIIDFNTRSSDKATGRAPTRGVQGNATKTIIGIPYSLGIRRLPVVITARGVNDAQGLRHAVRCEMDPAGRVRVRHRADAADCPLGTTTVTVALPTKACTTTPFAHWATAFSLFNPHAQVKILKSRADGESCSERRRKLEFLPSVAFPAKKKGWRKFLPGDRASAWWYDRAALAKHVFAYVGASESGTPDLSLFDFVQRFRGLSDKGRARAVCAKFSQIKALSDFRGREAEVGRLLKEMRGAAEAPDPSVLGFVGEAHLREVIRRCFGVLPDRWWYSKCAGRTGDIPFTLEVAVAETERSGRLFHGLNFSPTFDDPLQGAELSHHDERVGLSYSLSDFLGRHYIRPGLGKSPNVAAVFHLACPALEFTDKGKTHLIIPEKIEAAVAEHVWRVSKRLWREGERRRRHAAASNLASSRSANGGEPAEPGNGLLPRPFRGRVGKEERVRHEMEGLASFAERLKEIAKRLSFNVSSRGWCYILENEYGLPKGDFDRAQELITKCRKSGLLPIDFTAEDETRMASNLEKLDDVDPKKHAVTLAGGLLEWARYTPVSFWDFQSVYIQVVVEKIDLKTLFSPVCAMYRVPLINSRGWSDLNLRAGLMGRFKEHEERGRRPILLTCGDLDPVGLNICDLYRKHLAELAKAVGWSPENLIIKRFGLNCDFIEMHKLSWIDGLQTGSGKDLGDPLHPHHKASYVQNYIHQYGKRKVEANALVVRPDEGRRLCQEAIEECLDMNAIEQFERRLSDERDRVKAALPQAVMEALRLMEGTG